MFYISCSEEIRNDHNLIIFKDDNIKLLEEMTCTRTKVEYYTKPKTKKITKFYSRVYGLTDTWYNSSSENSSTLLTSVPNYESMKSFEPQVLYYESELSTEPYYINNNEYNNGIIESKWETKDKNVYVFDTNDLTAKYNYSYEKEGKIDYYVYNQGVIGERWVDVTNGQCAKPEQSVLDTYTRENYCIDYYDNNKLIATYYYSGNYYKVYGQDIEKPSEEILNGLYKSAYRRTYYYEDEECYVEDYAYKYTSIDNKWYDINNNEITLDTTINDNAFTIYFYLNDSKTCYYAYKKQCVEDGLLLDTPIYSWSFVDTTSSKNIALLPTNNTISYEENAVLDITDFEILENSIDGITWDNYQISLFNVNNNYTEDVDFINYSYAYSNGETSIGEWRDGSHEIEEPDCDLLDTYLTRTTSDLYDCGEIYRNSNLYTVLNGIVMNNATSTQSDALTTEAFMTTCEVGGNTYSAIRLFTTLDSLDYVDYGFYLTSIVEINDHSVSKKYSAYGYTYDSIIENGNEYSSADLANFSSTSLKYSVATLYGFGYENLTDSEESIDKYDYKLYSYYMDADDNYYVKYCGRLLIFYLNSKWNVSIISDNRDKILDKLTNLCDQFELNSTNYTAMSISMANQSNTIITELSEIKTMNQKMKDSNANIEFFSDQTTIYEGNYYNLVAFYYYETDFKQNCTTLLYNALGEIIYCNILKYDAMDNSSISYLIHNINYSSEIQNVMMSLQ